MAKVGQFFVAIDTPHARPAQHVPVGARQVPPEQTCPLGHLPSGVDGPHGVATQAPPTHVLPAEHIPHDPTLQLFGPQATPAHEQVAPLSTRLVALHAPA
jgi:hypothetical protein